MVSRPEPSPRPSRSTLRDRLEHRPLLGGLVLCAAAALVVGLSSADWEVEAGDTLYSIARATNSSVDAIAAANDIADPDLIYVGEVFVTPEVDGDDGARPPANAPDAGPPADQGPPPDAPSSDATTTSRPGDTLETIATRLGTTVDQLLVANGYTHGPLSVGRRVRAASPPPPSAGGGGPATHVVANGEVLAGIADRYGVSWRDLAEANDLADPDLITTGTRLTIPGGGGGMACPVDGAASFINDYGVAKPGGRHHEGIDVHADRGTPVVAPVSGRVEHVTGTRGGLQYHLFGDDGYRYWGTHLDELGAAGRVEAGEVLGTVGTSGNAVGGPPHLHFEVYRDGISVNPWPTLSKVC